jgi:predicted dehydrogenase
MSPVQTGFFLSSIVTGCKALPHEGIELETQVPIGVGLVGAGERGCYILGARIAELWRETGMAVTAVYDVNPERSRDAKRFLEERCRLQGLEIPVTVCGSLDELISDPSVAVIMVTTHTDQHRKPAVAALRSGKTVYLDKPIAVTVEDAAAILACERETGNKLIMGFTRRYEASWRKAYDLVRDGAIGRLTMMQIRSVIPYTRYFQTWHRRSAWSGGALNDKSSHHFDVFSWFAGSRCLSLSAVGGRSGIFPPDPDAPLRCSECSRVCLYRRSLNPEDQQEGTQVLGYDSWLHAEDERNRADTCVYYPGADIIDHAICHLTYENEVKASHFWCIYGPHASDQETFELIGTQGRIVLTRSEGTVRLVRYGSRDETVYDLKNDEFFTSHYGADLQLIRDIRGFRDGREPAAGTADGYSSLALVRETLSSIEAGGELRRLEETAARRGGSA